MLQEILAKTSNDLLSGLTEKVGLGQGQAKQALDLTKDNLLSTVGKEAFSGNLDGILEMVNLGASADQSPIFQSILNSLNKDFISKMGLPPELAAKVSTVILPAIIKAISDYKEGNLDASDLTKMLGGGLGESMLGKAGNLLKGGLGNFFK
jgi:hypothetical protein